MPSPARMSAVIPVRLRVSESNRLTDANSRSVTAVNANGSTPSITPPSATCGRPGLPAVSATITLPTSPSVWIAARLSSRISGRTFSSTSIRTVIGLPGSLGRFTASTRPTETPL